MRIYQVAFWSVNTTNDEQLSRGTIVLSESWVVFRKHRGVGEFVRLFLSQMGGVKKTPRGCSNSSMINTLRVDKTDKSVMSRSSAAVLTRSQ